MKKYLSACLAVLAVFTFAGCFENQTKQSGNSSSSVASSLSSEIENVSKEIEKSSKTESKIEKEVVVLEKEEYEYNGIKIVAALNSDNTKGVTIKIDDNNHVSITKDEKKINIAYIADETSLALEQFIIGGLSSAISKSEGTMLIVSGKDMGSYTFSKGNIKAVIPLSLDKYNNAFETIPESQVDDFVKKSDSFIKSLTVGIKYLYDETDSLSKSFEEYEKENLEEKTTANVEQKETANENNLNTDTITPKITLEQKNAVKKADSYLQFSAFSHGGLIEQLEYEGFSKEAAAYAADNCGADWFEQSLKKAKSYLRISEFSYLSLIEQLEYEGFTNEQAKYAADNCKADWKTEAAKKAKRYLEFSAFSKQSLIEQLEYEGFTYEEAVYGAEQNGY